MPSLIANCLARLVREGRISQKAATQAQALHDGMQGRLGEEMGPASADAAGALEAARVMAEQARARKVSIAKDAIALSNARERMAAHPKGKVAGLGAMLVRDIYEHGGENVEKASEAIYGKLDAMFGPGNEALGAKFFGLRQDTALAEDVLREAKGQNTGNGTARQIADGWKQATDYIASRAKAAGKLFTIAEDWHVPQFWNSARVHGVSLDQWTGEIMAEMKAGGLRVFDKETGAEATAMKLPEILKGAYHDITTGGGRGTGSGAFSPDMRVFRFADGKAGADSYINLMGKYGPGQDLYQMFKGHLHGAAREVALLEQFGPRYSANFAALQREAAEGVKMGAAKTIPLLSTPAMLNRMWNVLTGKSYGVENEAFAGIMAGVRGWLTAVQLPGAILSSGVGDSATTSLASLHMGIPAVRVLKRAADIFAHDTPNKRALAARLGIVAHAAGESALDHARYQGEWLTHDTAGKVANFMLKVTGLEGETNALKRAFTMEALGHIADQTGKGYKALDAKFRGFLDRYGISAEEWDALRKTPLIDAEGARFFDAGGVENERLGEKLMGAVLSERSFAVMEPDVRVRARMTPMAPRGTFLGEAGRGIGMYKSFAVSMMTTHMMRAALQQDLGSKIGYATNLALFTTVAGAASLLMKDIVYGKDPRQMNRYSFWAQAAVQGGGLGIFGDFFSSTLSRADQNLATTIAGPLAALGDDTLQVFRPAFLELFNGKKSAHERFAGAEGKLGAGLAREIRNYLIPTPFYLRLARDRLMMDTIQSAIDPNYRKSWARQEQTAKQGYGTQFWWRPGDKAPTRGPDIGNVIH